MPDWIIAAGRLGRFPFADQGPADRGEPGHAHVDDQGAGEPGEGRPVEPAGASRVIVAGDEGDGRGRFAVRDGDARIGGRPEAGRHPRHDLERHAVRAEVLGLLAPSAEDEGVAPLEADDPTAEPGVLDQDRLISA